VCVCFFLWLPIVLYICSVFVCFVIVKLSRSGSAFLVVDCFGNVYSFPRVLVSRLVSGGVVSKGFLLGVRLPGRVSSDRFVVSPVFDPVSGVKRDFGPPDVCSGVVESLGVDGFSVKGRDRVVKSKVYSREVDV
jgi:hypothetical protein